jgi:hypothetical protein
VSKYYHFSNFAISSEPKYSDGYSNFNVRNSDVSNLVISHRVIYTWPLNCNHHRWFGAH